MDREEHAPVTRTIARAVSILASFEPLHTELGVTEIGQLTGLDKSTVYRLLSALQQGGLIEQNAETSRYHLGFGLLRLAGLALRHLDLPRITRPFLRELAARTGETVNLSMLTEGDRIVYVDSVESHHRVRHVAPLGHELPLHAAAGGKALLAHMPAHRLERIMARGLESYTERTITDQDALLRALDDIRQTGYASSEEELEPGLSGVAATIWSHESRPVAAIGASGPSFRLTGPRLTEFGMAARETAADISRQIGHAEHRAG